MAILAFFKDGCMQNKAANIEKKKGIICLSITEAGYSVSHQCQDLCPSVRPKIQEVTGYHRFFGIGCRL